MKHTPGPWKIQALGARPGYPDWKSFCVRSESTNVHIATVGNVDRYYEGREEANARLIAAAPDLLSALEWACSQQAVLEMCGKETADWYGPAKAALEKAKGNS